jgi:phosphotransferase system HPr-like phosphotransfer protein
MFAQTAKKYSKAKKLQLRQKKMKNPHGRSPNVQSVLQLMSLLSTRYSDIVRRRLRNVIDAGS